MHSLFVQTHERENKIPIQRNISHTLIGTWHTKQLITVSFHSIHNFSTNMWSVSHIVSHWISMCFVIELLIVRFDIDINVSLSLSLSRATHNAITAIVTHTSDSSNSNCRSSKQIDFTQIAFLTQFQSISADIFRFRAICGVMWFVIKMNVIDARANTMLVRCCHHRRPCSLSLSLFSSLYVYSV